MIKEIEQDLKSNHYDCYQLIRGHIDRSDLDAKQLEEAFLTLEHFSSILPTMRLFRLTEILISNLLRYRFEYDNSFDLSRYLVRYSYVALVIASMLDDVNGDDFSKEIDLQDHILVSDSQNIFWGLENYNYVYNLFVAFVKGKLFTNFNVASIERYLVEAHMGNLYLIALARIYKFEKDIPDQLKDFVDECNLIEYHEMIVGKLLKEGYDFYMERLFCVLSKDYLIRTFILKTSLPKNVQKLWDFALKSEIFKTNAIQLLKEPDTIEEIISGLDASRYINYDILTSMKNAEHKLVFVKITGKLSRKELEQELKNRWSRMLDI